MRKRRASKHRRMRRMTVAGGEKELHSGSWSSGGRGKHVYTHSTVEAAVLDGLMWSRQLDAKHIVHHSLFR